MAKAKKSEVNLFQKAADEAAKTPAPKTVKGKPAPQAVTMPGLRKLAALDTAIKALTTLKKTTEAEIKDTALDVAVDRGMAVGKHPGNFDLVEDGASAKFQLKKRSSASTIREEEAGILDELGIPTEKVIERPAMFGVNEKYASDQAVLDKVSKALVKMGLTDFIVMQTEVSRRVTTEETINAVFQKVTDKEQLKQVLPLVCSLALAIKDMDAREALLIAINFLEDNK